MGRSYIILDFMHSVLMKLLLRKPVNKQPKKSVSYKILMLLNILILPRKRIAPPPYLSTRASETSPAMAMPIWLSILNNFC